MARLPASVLFVCTYNRVRSPMAAGLMRKLHGDAIRVESCGLDPEGEVDPFAEAVMAEVGVDLSTHRSRALRTLKDAGFELMIALSDEALHELQHEARDGTVVIEHWPTEDPATDEGSRDTRLEAYRTVRRSLEAMITARFS